MIIADKILKPQKLHMNFYQHIRSLFN